MSATVDLPRRLAAEALGTLLLLATVVGSGIMADRLADGNVALALLGNTIPTGAILFVLIAVFGPVSGAHFNPAVTLAFRVRGEMHSATAALYVFAQIAGAVAGVMVAHAMFSVDILQLSTTPRSGPGQWFSEFVASFGLVAVILGTLRHGVLTVAAGVGLYITAAYWFTASTSFANPAVTIGRTLTDTFSGIGISHAPAFIVAQFTGAVAAVATMGYITASRRGRARRGSG